MNMKRLIYSLLICLGVITFTSCEKTSDDISKVTHFASLELKGDDVMKIKLNEVYTEPGYTASEGNEDITDNVKITGAVDNTKSDIYTLVYSVANVDGFSVSQSRRVLVAASTFASAYFGETKAGTRHYVNAPIQITDKGDGTYEINDIMGGFQFYGLNPSFADAYDLKAEAIIKLEANNTISMVKLGTWAPEVGVTVLALNSGSYDPATGAINLSLKYNTSELLVTLTK